MKKNASTQSARGVIEFVPIPKHEQVLNEKGRVTHKLEIDGLEFWLVKIEGGRVYKWAVTEETSSLNERFKTQKEAIMKYTEYFTRLGTGPFKEKIASKIEAREQHEQAQKERARVEAEKVGKILKETTKMQEEQERAQKRREGSPLERYEQARLDVDELERDGWNISDDGKIEGIDRSGVFLSVDDFLVDYIGEKDGWNESDEKEAKKIIQMVESKLNFSELRDKAMTFEGQASLF